MEKYTMRKPHVKTVPPAAELELTWDPVPSAQTLFRYHLLNPEADDKIAQIVREKDPQAWKRDREAFERIDTAATAEELLDLVPVVGGVAEPLWHRRMREFGPQAVPLIAERLKRARDIEDEDAQIRAYEHLLSTLYWKGEAGATALLERFDGLTGYARSLACVVLGLLGAQASADVLWGFYQRVKDDTREGLFVGPLWGLIDLHDARAADALADLLWEQRYFHELFGFLSLAGHARAVLPLLVLSMMGKGEIAQHAAMALLSIAHRIGREALLVELQKAGAQTAEQQRHREEMADHILATSPRQAEEYFASFYRGLNADDLARIERMAAEAPDLGSLFGSRPPSVAAVSPPASMPGRNDPCWCGSGKKYKHCHMQGDRRKAE